MSSEPWMLAVLRNVRLSFLLNRASHSISLSLCHCLSLPFSLSPSFLPFSLSLFLSPLSPSLPLSLPLSLSPFSSSSSSLFPQITLGLSTPCLFDFFF